MKSPRSYLAIAGLVLIAVSVVFFFGTSGVIQLTGNWWALFIFIPAFLLCGLSGSVYLQAQHRFTVLVSGLLTLALLLTAVGVISLLNLDWGIMWPIFPFLVGCGLLASWNGSNQKERS